MELPFAVPDNDAASLRSKSATTASRTVSVANSAVGYNEETIDFAYVNVSDDNEVDIWLDGSSIPSRGHEEREDNVRPDILTFLLQEQTSPSHNQFLTLIEQGHQARTLAVDDKSRGELKAALDHHTEAAHCFHQAASIVQQHDAALAKSLLLLSQTQAQAAKTLQRIIHLPPLRRVVLYRKPEADLSASTFLGTSRRSTTADHNPGPVASPNAIDEMMELERELRSMDMKLDLNNSMASLDARNRMKNSMSESFMVIPPSGLSSSFMSSAPLPRNRSRPQRPVTTTKGATATPPLRTDAETTITTNLESSWWGNASQFLGSQSHQPPPPQQSPLHQATPQANTKQIMRLMESFRTLSNENAALLRRLEEAEAARAEALAARKEMKKFKEDYSEKFVRLKNQLSEIRRDYPTAPPVLTSQYLRPASASATEQIQRQEQLIRKLTADLKKEKQENKEKDTVLQKYEVFYKQVKARSAEKKKQQQQQKSG